MLGRQLARVLWNQTAALPPPWSTSAPPPPPPPALLWRNTGAPPPRRCLASLQQPAALDPVQEALLSEPCILVDTTDRVIGQSSKRDCHKIVEGSSPLHRAFSLFIFNQAGQLLLQKRSCTKVTFPDMWTNSCCSHPLATPAEMEETDALGVRLAAHRRAAIELGLRAGVDCRPEQIRYLTRILYAAASGDGEWGEHELDYILFYRGDVSLRPNAEEVSAVEWVERAHLPEFLAEVRAAGGQLTPWFQLISQNLLPEWWRNLDRIEEFQDHSTIHTFPPA